MSIDMEREFSSKTNTKTGLTSAVVRERFEVWGPNELAEKKVNPILLFLSYFWVRFADLAERDERALNARARLHDARVARATQRICACPAPAFLPAPSPDCAPSSSLAHTNRTTAPPPL